MINNVLEELDCFEDDPEYGLMSPNQIEDFVYDRESYYVRELFDIIYDETGLFGFPIEKLKENAFECIDAYCNESPTKWSDVSDEDKDEFFDRANEFVIAIKNYIEKYPDLHSKYQIRQSEQYDEVIRKLKSKKSNVEENSFTLSLDEMMKLELEPPKWLVKSLLLEKGITIFSGMPASSKSFFSLYLAVCTANGLEVLGQKSNKKIKVLYIDEENNLEEINHRVKRILQGLKVKEGDINFAIRKNVKLDSKEHLKNLTKYYNIEKPDLIICDSLVRLMEGNEDKSSDVRRVFDNIKKFDCAWLVLHHVGKGGNKLSDLRGSSDFIAMADNIFNIIRRKGVHTFALRQQKARTLSFISGIEYQIKGNNEEPIIFEKLGDLKTENTDASENLATEINDWIKQINLSNFRTGEVSKEFNESGYLTRRALEYLENLGAIFSSGKGNWKVNKDSVL